VARRHDIELAVLIQRTCHGDFVHADHGPGQQLAQQSGLLSSEPIV
jgi:hypothetical protein